jgi:ligand-binding sensor domain-containing protein
MWIRLSAIWLAALVTSALGAPHVYRIHRNAELTVYAMVEDPTAAVMWLGTQQGIYTFDGVRYRKEAGFPMTSARQIGFSGDGTLWAAGRGGLARLRRGEKWEIVSREEVAEMSVLRDRVVGKAEQGFEIDLDGRVKQWQVTPRAEMLLDGSGRLNWVDSEYLWRRTDGSVMRVGDYLTAVEDRKGQRWLGDDARVARLDESGEVVEQHRRRAVGTLSRQTALWVSARTGEAWFAGNTLRNLTRGIEFEAPAELSSFAVMCVYEDHRGRMWASMRGLGLVEWREEAGWQRWGIEEFAFEQPSQVLAPDWIVGKRAIFHRDGDRWKEFAKSERGYSAVLPLEGGRMLTASSGSWSAVLDGAGREVSRIGQEFAGESPRKIVRDGRGEIWASNGVRLSRLKDGRFEEEEVAGIALGPGPYSFLDVTVDGKGALWVSFRDKVARREAGGKWELMYQGLPLVRSISVGKKLWLASTQGKLLELSSDGGRREFDSPAAYTNWVREDSRGWIWVGEADGVHISDGKKFGPSDWLHLRGANGLAAGQPERLGFLEEPKTGAVWIAGPEGVARIEPREEWFDERAEAASVRRREEGVFEVGSLASGWWRQYPFEYRVQPGPARWEPVKRGEIVMPTMGAGEYQLEVRGVGGGKVRRAEFAVESAMGRWLQWGVVLLGMGLGMFALRRQPWVKKGSYWVRKWAFLRRTRKEDIEGDWRIHRPGEVLFRRYELVRLVSRGGFSSVFEARDLEEPKRGRLAVKVLRPIPGQESWSREHFAQEVAALRSLEHQGVVGILDSWITEAGEPCLAMPLLDGSTLRAKLEMGPLEPRKAGIILAAMGEAIEEIHRRGIVHRDLKPENVMLCGEAEQPVLIDFGAAGLAAASDELAITTLLAGSIHYLAPERLTGHYSAASDVYSLGVMALEMVSGRRLADLGYMQMESEFLPALREALTPALGDKGAVVAELLAGAFESNPRRRPGNVREWTSRLALEFGR